MMRRGVDTADNNTDANNNKDKDNNNNNNANGCQIIMDEEEEEEDATMRLRRREDEEEDAMLRPSAPTPRRFKEERLPLETVHALRELTRGSEERRDNNNNINEEEDGEATGGGWTSLRVPAGFLSCQVAEDDNNNEEDAGADGKKRQRRSWLDHIDSTQVAHAIIKNKAADDRLHVLAIARRLRYCLDA